MRQRLVWLIIIVIICLGVPEAKAQSVFSVLDLFIDSDTLSKGYTLVSHDENFHLGIRPEILAVETRIVLKQYQKEDFDDFPAGWLPVSNVYEFDIFNKKAFQNEKPLIARIIIDNPEKREKRLFFWNGLKESWIELPSETKDYSVVDSIIHLPYAKMVILAKDDSMAIGDASWYGYKSCMCAASPDYPKGTKLKVKDLDTEKEIVVEVNDYGPDRSIHPERVIDLDKIAFRKLGPLSCGILRNILVTEIK